MNGRLQSLGTLNPPPPHARSDGRASRPRCGIGISGEGIGYGGVAGNWYKTFLVFATFTGIGFAADTVHGNRKRSMRFSRDRTQ